MEIPYELLIVLPAYNEENNLPHRILGYKKAKWDVRFQLVIVNNGPTDGTAKYQGEVHNSCFTPSVK